MTQLDVFLGCQRMMGKRNPAFSLDGFGLKTAPGPSVDISAERHGRVNAINIMVHRDKVFRVQESMVWLSRYDNTFANSQVSEYLDTGGRDWNTPFSTLDTSGYWPVDTLST